ncbi:MAG: zinc uptake protein ZrgA [Marinomonas sp.]
MIVKSKWAALAGLCVSAGAIADHHGEEEKRDHKAHVHGEVSFNIAQDGEDLILAISAPGADIVGFENAPETAQEKEALKQAIARLENPASLFIFDKGAQCQLSDHLIEQSLSAHDEHDEDHHDEHHDDHDKDHHDDHDKDHHDDHDEDHHDEHGEDHHDDHDEDHHDEHGEDHHDDHDEDHHDEHGEDHHDEHGEESHAAFEITYQYECHNVEKLTEIETNWFKHFPNTQEIHVNLLTDNSQKVLELDAKHAHIDF